MITELKNKAHAILKWSERYTKTDMLYLTKGGFWLILGQIISTIAAFLLSIAFANLLPKETFGTYRFIISIVSIFLVTSLNGINAPLIQAVARGLEGSVKEALCAKIRWGVMGSGASLLLAGYYLYGENLTLSLAFASAAFVIPFFDSFTVYDSYLTGKKLFKESTTYESLSKVISCVSIFIALLLTDNVILITLAFLLPWTAVRAFYYYVTLRKYPPNQELDHTITRSGKHLSILGGIGSLATYLDNILLFHFLGPIQVAIYSFALAPIEQVRVFYKIIQALSVPKLSNKSILEIHLLLKSRLIRLLLLGILIAGCYVLLIPFFFQLFFPQYLDAILFSQLLSIVLALRLPAVFLGSVMESKIDITPPKWIHMRNIAHVAFIILLIVLTPLYGIVGVILSRIGSIIISFFILWTQWIWFVKGRHRK